MMLDVNRIWIFLSSFSTSRIYSNSSWEASQWEHAVAQLIRCYTLNVSLNSECWLFLWCSSHRWHTVIQYSASKCLMLNFANVIIAFKEFLFLFTKTNCTVVTVPKWRGVHGATEPWIFCHGARILIISLPGALTTFAWIPKANVMEPYSPEKYILKPWSPSLLGPESWSPKPLWDPG